MSAEIINLPVARTGNPGNGAREALIEIAAEKGTEPGDARSWADLVLMELWYRGYQVMPLPPEQDGAA